MQTLFISRRNTRGKFGQNGRRQKFYHKNFDSSQSEHPTARVSRGSNQNFFASRLFQFSDLKTQQRYILQEEVIISKSELSSLVYSLCEFLKTFDHSGKWCIRFLPPNLDVEIGCKKSKDNLFAHYYNDTTKHPKGQICLSFRFGTKNSCVSSIKKFKLLGKQFVLTGIVNLNHHEIQ